MPRPGAFRKPGVPKIHPASLLLDETGRVGNDCAGNEDLQVWRLPDPTSPEGNRGEEAAEGPRAQTINPVRDDPSLVGLVDTITGDNGAVSDADLANLLGTSRSSVNRIRHDLRYSYRPLRHGPLLEDRQVEARLAFCRSHMDCDWSMTIFTDESRFATSPDCPVMSWTKRGQNAYIQSQKFPASFMVWGGIVGNQKTRLLKCPNRMDSDGYIQLLEANGVVEFMPENGVALFQQDGATCHTSRKTSQWFAEKGVALLNGWPSNSPDLSPIEQVWGISKRFIIQRYGMRTPITLAQLETATFEAFDTIQPRTIAILTKSVEFRVRLCVQRNGRFIGDAIEECCRRASIEVDSVNDIQNDPFTLIANGRSDVRHGDEPAEEQDRPLASLPSFRTVQ